MRDNPQLQQDDLPIWLALKYKFERLYVSDTPCRPYAVRPRDRDDPHDDAHLEGENSVKRQKMTKHETYVFGESSFGQANESESGPSTSGNQEQLDDFDFWTDSYATNDDELPIEKVLQELVEDMLQTIDEAKLRKVEEILLSPHPQKPTSVVQSCQIDPKAPALSLKRSLGPEKIVMSLHKFPAVIFPDDDIEERTSRWETDIQEKDKNKAKNDKTEHEKEKSEKRSQSQSQSQPRQSQVKVKVNENTTSGTEVVKLSNLNYKDLNCKDDIYNFKGQNCQTLKVIYHKDLSCKSTYNLEGLILPKFNYFTPQGL
ncbi:hypothetical protein Tco_0846304 [Tanacetum coccineum]